MTPKPNAPEAAESGAAPFIVPRDVAAEKARAYEKEMKYFEDHRLDECKVAGGYFLNSDGSGAHDSEGNLWRAVLVASWGQASRRATGSGWSLSRIPLPGAETRHTPVRWVRDDKKPAPRRSLAHFSTGRQVRNNARNVPSGTRNPDCRCSRSRGKNQPTLNASRSLAFSSRTSAGKAVDVVPVGCWLSSAREVPRVVRFSFF
jgi:hypothetical protein